MSPRAACRLEAFGFEQVYDYVGGIADWKAAGLELGGAGAKVQRVIDATRPDIPTCAPRERLGDVRTATFAADWDECVVVDCDRVVVGRLRGATWEGVDDLPVEDVMESGPTTVRPDGLLQPLVERMATRGTRLVLVATPQGRLLGAILREEAERLVAGESPEQVWRDCDGCPGRWAVSS